MTDEYSWSEANVDDCQKVFGEVAYLIDGNIAFKCGSPNSVPSVVVAVRRSK